jgi:hypothetical protein
LHNNRLQRTPLRAAAEPERPAEGETRRRKEMIPRKFNGFSFEQRNNGTILISQQNQTKEGPTVIELTADDAPILIKCLQESMLRHRRKSDCAQNADTTAMNP